MIAAGGINVAMNTSKSAPPPIPKAAVMKEPTKLMTTKTQKASCVSPSGKVVRNSIMSSFQNGLGHALGGWARRITGEAT